MSQFVQQRQKAHQNQLSEPSADADFREVSTPQRLLGGAWDKGPWWPTLPCCHLQKPPWAELERMSTMPAGDITHLGILREDVVNQPFVPGA